MEQLIEWLDGHHADKLFLTIGDFLATTVVCMMDYLLETDLLTILFYEDTTFHFDKSLRVLDNSKDAICMEYHGQKIMFSVLGI